MPSMLMRASACGYFKEAEIDDQRDYIAVRWRFCDSRTQTVRSAILASAHAGGQGPLPEPGERARRAAAPLFISARSSSTVKGPAGLLWRS